MNREQTEGLLQQYGQGHILAHLRRLEPERRSGLLRSLEGLDLPFLKELHRNFCQKDRSPGPAPVIQPAPVISLPRTAEDRARRKEARQKGEELLRRNQVAVLIVAGGQGSRLGFEGPKGIFPISPLRNKSLFQLFAESVKALSARFRASLPLLIMTSEENREATREFFERHRFFDLSPEKIHFFDQGVFPTLTPSGGLILRDETSLFVNPDGHGGSLRALHRSGMLDRLLAKGITELFYCQVDNPLVKIADPVFLGYHLLEGAEISTKVVRRAMAEEKVGVYGILNGRPAVIEYSDMRPEDMAARNEQGELLYWAGNIAVHVLSLAFVRRLNEGGFALPYHRAIKVVEALDGKSRPRVLTGWKFETFLFDAIPLARKSCCLEVRREEEFAPVKNREGVDSPQTARSAMNALFRRWLHQAGARVDPEVQVEICPLFALDGEELKAKLAGRNLVIREDTYFE